MIDTGLIDEMQAGVINRLREQGMLGKRTRTRMIPARYATYVELGNASLDHFGFRILMPQQRNSAGRTRRTRRTGWSPAQFVPATDALLLTSLDFNAPLQTDVSQVNPFIPSSDGDVNAIRITGCAHLTDAASLGATNAFNGDKVVPFHPARVHRGQRARVSIENHPHHD